MLNNRVIGGGYVIECLRGWGTPFALAEILRVSSTLYTQYFQTKCTPCVGLVCSSLTTSGGLRIFRVELCKSRDSVLYPLAGCNAVNPRTLPSGLIHPRRFWGSLFSPRGIGESSRGYYFL